MSGQPHAVSESSRQGDARLRTRQIKSIVKGLTLLGTLAGVGWLAQTGGLGDVLSEEWIDARIRGHGAAGWLTFVVLTGAATAVGLPRQIPAFLGGYAFGFVGGTLLATLGAGLGCLAGFFYARFLGRSFVRRRMGKRISKIDAVLAADPLRTAVLIRFLPVGNNLLTNLLAGVSSAKPIPFVLGSMLGYVPQHLVFSLLGSGMQVQPAWRISLSVVLFIVSTLWGYRLYRRHRKRMALNGDDEVS